eukprot:870018-Amphidinium_carterae.1
MTATVVCRGSKKKQRTSLIEVTDTDRKCYSAAKDFALKGGHQMNPSKPHHHKNPGLLSSN